MLEDAISQSADRNGLTKIDPKSIEIRLEPILDEKIALKKEFSRRKVAYQSIVIHKSDIDERIADGWSLRLKRKRSAVMQRPKPHSKMLEDRVWALFHKMGYPILNGDAFKISFLRDDGSKGQKQIDVFCKDAETVCVVECKSKQHRGRRTLQKDLHETAFLKKSIANSIRSQFGADHKPKIIWIYATENIIWSEPDAERAASENIKIIDENELRYFEAYIDHMGPAGRYQFLAEMLAEQEVPGLSGIKVPAVKGRFGKQVFYSFTVTAGHLLKLAFVNHHALNHPLGRPAYQRMIDKGRLAAIGQFINSGGFFPTNILVNIKNRVTFEPLPKGSDANGLQFGHILLPSKYKSIFIIDGQHRLFGFTHLDEIERDAHPLFIVAFDRMDPVKEADLFVTINSTQKSVPKPLLVDLQADLKIASADQGEALNALASMIIRRLSRDNTSPFYRRFQAPGVPPDRDQTLTVPEIQKGLIKSQLLGRVIKGTKIPGVLSAKTDDLTMDRASSVISGYFSILESLMAERWAAGRMGHVVVNPGIRSHLGVAGELVRRMGVENVLDPYLASEKELLEALRPYIEVIASWFARASLSDIEERFARKYGEGGARDYQFHLWDILCEIYPKLVTDEHRAYKAQADAVRITQAREDVQTITSLITEVTIETLKKVHGRHELPSGEKAYWELGIDDSSIKKKAYDKQQAAKTEKRAPREAYLDIVDFEKIIKQPSNFPHLKSLFNIPLPKDDTKGRVYHLDWISEFNSIRQTCSHSSPYRKPGDEDYDFLEWLKSELFSRAEAAGFGVGRWQ